MDWLTLKNTANYDESKAGGDTLPDPLAMPGGARVTSASEWRLTRRLKVLGLFESHMYGKVPAPIQIEPTVVEASDNALGGIARRRQVTIGFAGHPGGPKLNVLIYTPRAATSASPCFLGLSFYGNHTTTHEPEVILSDGWMRPTGQGVVDNKATEAARGTSEKAWPMEQIIRRGYAVATLYYGDADPDFDDGFKNGVHTLFHDADAPRQPDNPSSITAWAWSLSRVMDYLVTVPEIDAKRVCLTGHSRLGKTSLWAGATDERFALVVSNNSGCGGASLSRRNYGETLYILTKVMPHWFCGRCAKWAETVEQIPVDPQIPVDQHMLMALIAPRPLFISSAQDDTWCDPKGEYLSGYHASGVYRLFGHDGLASRKWPAVGEKVMSRIGYQMRAGGHAITPEDWQVHLDFADRHLGKP
jgi:hypothetical protein